MEYETFTMTVYFRDPNEHEDVTFDDDELIKKICESIGCSEEKAEEIFSAEMDYIEEKGLDVWADVERQDELYSYCAKKASISKKKAGDAVKAVGSYMVDTGFLVVVMEAPAIDEETGLLGVAEAGEPTENELGEKAAYFKVTKGSMSRGSRAIVLREGEKIYEGEILRIKACGLLNCTLVRTNAEDQTIVLEGFDDLRQGDIIECYRRLS